MVSPDHLEAIRTRGYSIIKSALSQENCLELRQKLRQEIDRDIEKWSENPAYIDHWMVHNLMLRDPAFMEVLDNGPLHACLDELLDDKCIVYAYTSSSLQAGGGTNYSNRIHVDCPRFIENYTTNYGAIFALDDFTEDNGATYVLPYSHLSPNAPTEEEFMSGAKRILAKRGDLIIFNSRLFHLGGKNTTNKDRHAITLNICRSFMRQRFDYPKMIPEAVYATLSDRQRRFLGYNVRIPASLEDYYVPANQRLYQPGQG